MPRLSRRSVLAVIAAPIAAAAPAPAAPAASRVEDLLSQLIIARDRKRRLDARAAELEAMASAHLPSVQVTTGCERRGIPPRFTGDLGLIRRLYNEGDSPIGGPREKAQFRAHYETILAEHRRQLDLYKKHCREIGLVDVEAMADEAHAEVARLEEELGLM